MYFLQQSVTLGPFPPYRRATMWRATLCYCIVTIFEIIPRRPGPVVYLRCLQEYSFLFHLIINNSTPMRFPLSTFHISIIIQQQPFPILPFAEYSINTDFTDNGIPLVWKADGRIWPGLPGDPAPIVLTLRNKAVTDINKPQVQLGITLPAIAPQYS